MCQCFLRTFVFSTRLFIATDTTFAPRTHKRRAQMHVKVISISPLQYFPSPLHGLIFRTKGYRNNAQNVSASEPVQPLGRRR